MKHIYTVLVLVALVALGLSLFKDSADTSVLSDSGNTYSSEKYGISFTYPDGYVLEEGERDEGHRGHYAIVLIREEDSELPGNGEGPTAITVDIYQNNLDQQSLLGWLKGTSSSNFKLSPEGTYASTTLDTAEAVNYRWSGLYEGETTALRHAGNIVAISVTFLTLEDENISVYRELLRSVRLSPLKPIAEDEAVSFLQGMGPEFTDYPSDNLPPKRVAATQTPDGWYVGFLMHGSGRAGILRTTCFFVSNAKEATKTGEFAQTAGAGPEELDLKTCN